jgi:putative colanic acid biosynthesis acetyltransferase WcaF
MDNNKIKYESPFSLKNKIYCTLWLMVSFFCFRPFVSIVFNRWRVFLLKLFGAKIGKGSIVYASMDIPMPNKLTMGILSCIGPNVKLHRGAIRIGSKVTISQGTYLCSASHDISSLNKPFISAPIVINDFAWVAAEAFIGMGVTIGQGAVVGARAAVFKDVEPWTVVGGNPAKFIKKREITK